MRVGMFPICYLSMRRLPRLPHASGDVSDYDAAGVFVTSSSPCEWGCFWTGLPIASH